jgi:predicted DNA-binding ribbon-helix-helix protein
MPESRLISRNVMGPARRTSMRLEPELWEALEEMSWRERASVRELVRRLAAVASAGGRTSAVRVGILQYYRAAATEEGHRAAGHGSLPAAPAAG